MSLNSSHNSDCSFFFYWPKCYGQSKRSLWDAYSAICHGGGTVMVWSCFKGKEKRLSLYFTTLCHTLDLQQDTDLKHNSKLRENSLEGKIYQLIFSLWWNGQQSPDLKPTELRSGTPLLPGTVKWPQASLTCRHFRKHGMKSLQTTSIVAKVYEAVTPTNGGFFRTLKKPTIINYYNK